MALERRVILTGFMGAGKSSAGREAAGRLDVPHYDTDVWMRDSGRDVEELVRTNMSEFRRVEAETLEAVLELDPGIISTGGGIVSTEIGRSTLMAANAVVVWLRAPFEVLAEHVANDPNNTRPLFEDVDNAHRLFTERQVYYSLTAHRVINADQPVDLVAEEIVKIARPKPLPF